MSISRSRTSSFPLTRRLTSPRSRMSSARSSSLGKRQCNVNISGLTWEAWVIEMVEKGFCWWSCWWWWLWCCCGVDDILWSWTRMRSTNWTGDDIGWFWSLECSSWIVSGRSSSSSSSSLSGISMVRAVSEIIVDFVRYLTK